jgi:hypothetical protein
MRTTGIFTAHLYKVCTTNEGKPIYILPFGDIHKGSPMHNGNRWKAWLDWAKTKNNAYFLGMGDYFDLASSSERKILKSGLHESTTSTLDSIYMEKVLEITKELSFMKGRLIGLIEGNHFGEFQNGMTTTQKMCDILKCKYLGVASLIRLVVEGRGNRRSSVDVFAHHGKGFGRLVGSGLNNVQQMSEIADAQIYLMGDNHQKSLAYSDRMYLAGGKGRYYVRNRKQLYARTGSFLNGYKDGAASYVTDKLLNPTNLGTIKIELTPHVARNETGQEYFIDIHASL